jgi:glycosyltransferase involved in cell wall biosynthesis
VPRKTIGYYDDSQNLGGTTRYLLNLISGIDRSEFDLVFFAPRPQEWHGKLVAAGVEVHTVLPFQPPTEAPLPKPDAAAPEAPEVAPSAPPALGWCLGLASETVMLRKLFQRRRVDLLHSNNAGAEPAPIAARLAGLAPVLATWHVDSTYDLNNIRGGFRYRLLEKTCMRSLHHAIAVSRSTAADWIARCALGDSYWRKVTVIHNGVPVDSLVRSRSIEAAKAAAGISGRFVIGSAGRLETAKGYEYLIRGLPELVRSRPDVLLRIAGRGELQPKLLALARSLDVESHIEFAGFVEDVRGFLEGIDIYVQPSLCEAQGLAILEACAVGVPIVASAVGGIPECVQDGEMGIIVPPRQPEALARAIAELASKPSLRASMAAEGARIVRERFDSAQMIEKTLAVYRRILSV